MTARVHIGLPMAEYLAMPAVSSGILKAIVNACPARAWYESWLNPRRTIEQADQMDLGTVAHGILLEGSTENVEIIDADDWRTKAAREAREAAYAAGKTPILARKMEVVEAMVSAAWKFIKASEVADVFDNGQSEITLTWDEGDTPCRARPDRVSADNRMIVDYKSGGVSAEPDSWGRMQMVRMGYYISAAFYRRGMKACVGVEPSYTFLVQENEPPYLCSLVGVDPHAFELGERKVRHALDVWSQCVKANYWPAYPSRIVYPEIPTWEDARWEEFEARTIEVDPIQQQHGVQP